MVEKSLVSRQEAKIRDLETKVEFERTQIKRLEVGVNSVWRTDSGAGGTRAGFAVYKRKMLLGDAAETRCV